MPSVNIKLPKYVVARPKKDGTYRVLFEVPARLRPSDWLPTIPTPAFPDRTGRLDAAEVAAIKAHVEGAGGLLEQLQACRAGEVAPALKPGSLPALCAIWRASESYAALKPRTQAFYENGMRLILAWSATVNDPAVSKMTRPKIKEFLALYNDRQSQRAALRATLRALMEIAIDEGWRADNPAAGFRLRRTQKRRAVKQWTADAVETYAKAAISMGWPGGARMLRLMWQTSADASDVCTWRRDRHFSDGALPMILYDRGKTDVPAGCPIGAALAEDIRSSGDLYVVVGRSGRPYLPDDIKDDRRRSTDFRVLRRVVVNAGGPALLMDHLRHSAVTDAVECGADIEDTPALTAHIGSDMNRRIYLQKTLAQATAVQRKRGIIE